MKTKQTTTAIHRFRPTVLALLGFAPAIASAEDSTEFVEPNLFDQIWGYATLYKDDLNPVLQEFKLRGRYHGQAWDVDGSESNNRDWDDRRSRFGFDAKLFDKKIELRLDAQSNDGFEDAYDGLVDAYVKYKPESWLSITAGRTKPLIGQYDWLESTNTQPTFERSQIFNQLGINRAVGLTVEGTTDAFLWRAGIYKNDTPNGTGGTGRWGDGEFGDLDGGTSFTVGGGYDFKHLLNLEKADFRVDWLHSDRQADDVVLARYDDVISSTLWLKEGYAGLVLEAYHGSGGDGLNSDVFGFFIQPTYDVIPKKLQLVGRYSYAASSDDFGVVAQTRYERATPIPEISGVAGSGTRGDAYHAVYAGAQYFIYGDKLKLLAGAEYANLNRPGGDDFESITFLSGIRISF